MKPLAILLIVVGLFFAISGGLSYTDRDTVVDIGPVEVTAEETKRFPVSPVIGVVLAVSGVALLAFGGRKH